MKISTTETIAGRLVEETLGVVRGSILWSRRIMKFNHGGLRGLTYTTMDEMADGLQTAREGAEAKVMHQAKLLGADAIINVKLELMELTDGMFQAVATGTAVKTEALPQAVSPALPFSTSADNDDDAFAIVPIFNKPAIRLISSAVH